MRQAKTVFGCANLVLGELGQPQLQSAKGLNVAIAKISESIVDIILAEKTSDQKEKQAAKSLFVLVLDEFDALSLDKRSNISDFLYKLVTMEEKLREKGYLVCIIAISNNVTADYTGIDDRVKSRIGSATVLFEPYSEPEIQRILKDRASRALSVDMIL